MWSLARVAAQIEASTEQPVGMLEAGFKLPVSLPALLRLYVWESKDENRYLLTDEASARPHLSGSYTLS